MSKRPTILVMAGGTVESHIFSVLVVVENLQVLMEGVSSV